MYRTWPNVLLSNNIIIIVVVFIVLALSSYPMDDSGKSMCRMWLACAIDNGQFHASAAMRVTLIGYIGICHHGSFRGSRIKIYGWLLLVCCRQSRSHNCHMPHLAVWLMSNWMQIQPKEIGLLEVNRTLCEFELRFSNHGSWHFAQISGKLAWLRSRVSKSTRSLLSWLEDYYYYLLKWIHLVLHYFSPLHKIDDNLIQYFR